MSHTPGPWVYNVQKNGDNLSITGANGLSVIGGCGCCGSPWTAKASAEANARLIAAAPDLLALLEKANSFNFIEEGDEWFVECSNLIAKAKGETL